MIYKQSYLEKAKDVIFHNSLVLKSSNYRFMNIVLVQLTEDAIYTTLGKLIIAEHFQILTVVMFTILLLRIAKLLQATFFAVIIMNLRQA